MIFLQTDRLQLTNLRRSDTAALVAIRQNPDCARYQRWSDTTPDAIDAYIARHTLDQFLSRAEEQHYALRTPDGTLAGELSYFDNPRDRCISGRGTPMKCSPPWWRPPGHGILSWRSWP